MARLETYINETGTSIQQDPYKQREGRGKVVDKKELISWVLKNCGKSLDTIRKHKITITRFSDSKRSGGEFWLIDPKKASEPRRSRNTYNYYTLVMDNDPAWGIFPKRSQSLICESSFQRGMSGLFLVIPEDGTKIGVCPNQDIWGSMYDSGVQGAAALVVHTEIINFLLMVGNETLLLPVGGYSDISMYRYDAGYNVFKLACKSFDAYIKQKYGSMNVDSFINDHVGGDLKYYYGKTLVGLLEKYKGNLYKTIVDYWFNPATMNMSVVRAGEWMQKKREVWFSGKSAMIKWQYLPKVRDELGVSL